MQQLLPTTAQTNFDTEDAQSMAKKEDDQDSDKVVNSLQSGIKDGVNKAKETVNQWYNNLKGFLIKFM